MTNSLIENGFIVSANNNGDVIPNGYNSPEGDQITAQGAGSPPPHLCHHAHIVIDAASVANIAGMVSAHPQPAFSYGQQKTLPVLIKWPIQPAEVC